MISLTVRRKIMGIAVALIVLMAVTAVLSMASVIQVGDQLDELTRSYIPAYGNLARANIRSVERALDLRRIVIKKLQSPSNDVTAIRATFDAKGGEFDNEIEAARKLIGGLIEANAASGDTRSLVRLQTRLDAAVDDSRRHLNDEISRLLNQLETGNASAIDESLTRVDALRDELNSKLDGIRADMLALLRADADLTTQKQRRVTLIAAFLTLLAAVFGLVFSLLVSAGVTRPMDDTVNLASRLEGANKEYGGRILVSEATIAGASDAVEAHEIDRVAVLGQNRPQAVFEIMGGRKGELSPAQRELRDRFSEGLA